MDKDDFSSDISIGELRRDRQMFNQTAAARLVGISRSLMSKWKREAILEPSLSGRRDVRTQGRELRTYRLRDLVAGTFAKISSEQGFRGDSLREMVALVQRADEQQLDRSVVLAVQMLPDRQEKIPGTPTPGFIRQYWVRDMTNPLVFEDDEVPWSSRYATGTDFADEMRATGRLASAATLSQLVVAILGQIQKKLGSPALSTSTRRKKAKS